MRSTRVAGRLIADIRRQSGLSQAELARRAGLARSVVNAYERGHRQPGVDALARIAAAAGMQVRVEPALKMLDTERAGRILEQVLDLAEALPQRRRGRLTHPPLNRIEGGAAGRRPTSRAPLSSDKGGAAGHRPTSRAPLFQSIR